MSPRPTRVTVSSATSSAWIPVDLQSSKLGIGVEVTGTATYKVQHTFVDVQDMANLPVAATAIIDHDTLTGQTASNDGNYQFFPRAVRLTVTAHTSGDVIMTVTHTP